MNKICGYNCEHNKGGICQITACDKHIYLNTSTTIKPEVLTRWQDPTIEEYKKEIDRLNNTINEFDKWLIGEQMMFYKSDDGERLIRYAETTSKWLELKEGK